MTIIAWDGKNLAADRLVTAGSLAKHTTTKIKQIGQKLCGVTGESKYSDALFAWVEDGMISERFPNIPNEDQVVLIVIDDGKIYEYWSSIHRIVYSAKEYAAFGCGNKFALGAMSAGADAKQAVEIACQYDIYCGGGIDILRSECEQKGSSHA